MRNLIFKTLFFGLFLLSATAIFQVSLGVGTHEALALSCVLELTLLAFGKVTGKSYAMATVCGAISASIGFDCDNPMQAGTEDKAWIINKSDIDSITYNTNKMIVEDINLKVGKTAFTISGRNNSIMPSTALIKNTYTDVFDHIVNMVLFDISPAQKENLTGMISGKYVIVTENKFRGATGNSAFEIYGLDTGLELTVLTKDPNNADTQGAFSGTFATNKNKEPKMPRTVFITSYAATLAMLEGLE